MRVFRVLSVCLIFLCTGCFGRSGEIKYEIYNNVDEALEHGAFQRGWLPQWTPREAIDIHKHHDLDINFRAFSFKLLSPESFSWPSECKEATTIAKPFLKAKLFPNNVHELADIKNCKTLFVVMDGDKVVHAWGRN